MATLRLDPVSGPVMLTVDTIRDALAAYWGQPRGNGLARQGPDFYDAANGHPRGHLPIGTGGTLTPPGSRDPDQVVFGDIAWAVLLAGQPRPQAAQSVLKASPIPVDLPVDVALADADDLLIDQVTEVVWETQRASTPGVRVAIAVKMLHPKRPALLPVVDNQNIFGTYQNASWQLGDRPIGRLPGRSQLRDGLAAVRRVVGDQDNRQAWAQLDGWISPDGAGPFPRTVLFDMLWWALRARPELAIG